MRRRVERVLFLACICFSAAVGLVLAQARASPETRVVPLTVIDREGDPVLPLSAEQIRVRGVKADWKLQLDDSSHRTILLFDAIGSKRAEIFVRGFLVEAAPDDDIEFRAEWEGQQVVVPFTRDKSTILAALDSLRESIPQGADSREVGVRNLSDRLRGTTGAALRFGDAVILITRCGQPDRKSVDIMSQQGVRFLRLFVTALPPLPSDHIDLEAGAQPACIVGLGEPAMEEPEARTGGMNLNKRAKFFPRFNRDPFLLLIARHAYRFIKHTYRLELQLKEPLTKKRDLKVEVEDKQVKKRFSPEVFHPDILYPPSVTDN